MSQQPRHPSSRRGGQRWLRRLFIAAGVCVVLLIVAYFVGTSSAFLKSFVLPRVGATLNADVSVADLSLSPFSQVIVRDLKVQPKGKDTLLAAAELRARYRLMSILRGNIVVEEVAIESPTVTLVQAADGTSNLDPILKAAASQPAAGSTPSKSGPPPQVDIKSVTVKNATLRQTAAKPDGTRQVSEVANLNFTASNLKNGEAGAVTVAGQIKWETAPPAPGAAAMVRAGLDGKFDFELTPTLQPRSVKGGLKVLVTEATGAFSDLATFLARLDCDATPTEIRGLSLRFEKGPEDLGQVLVAGPFDSARTEGRLRVEVLNIDRRVLSLAGSAKGLDFGKSSLSSTNQIEILAGGKNLVISGAVNGHALSVAQGGMQTPTLELLAGYNVTVDQAQENAILQTLDLTASRGAQPLLKAALTKPMRLDWGKAGSVVDESQFILTLNELDLTDWRAFLGTNVTAGLASGKFELRSIRAGNSLSLTGNFETRKLEAMFDTLAVHDAAVGLDLNATLDAFRRAQITKLELRASQKGAVVATAQASGKLDLQTLDASLAVNANTTLRELTTLAAMPDLAVSAGTLRFDATIKQENTTLAGAPRMAFNRTVEGKLDLAGLTARYGDFNFDRLEAALPFNLEIKDDAAALRKFSGTLRQYGQPAGMLQGTGDFNTTTRVGHFDFTATGLNQYALKSFLEASLGKRQLLSANLGATLKGNFDPKGEGNVTGDVSLANLIVHDPDGVIPSAPLELKLKLDAGIKQSVAQLREGTFKLTPTQRGKNEATLKGTVDFSQTNYAGNLKLTAESIDLTTYYDLFVGDAKPAATATPTAPAPAPAEPEKEPDPITLPLRNFTVEAAIDRLYLREVDIAKFKTALLLDGSRVVLKPFELTLNGALFNAVADLNLAQPGYIYAITNHAAAVPLAPLVNSFVPDRKGTIQGTASLDLDLKGQGFTGANLQKHLAGSFGLGATNLQLSIVNVRSKLLKTVVNVIVGIPDLIKNPTAKLGNLVGSLLGGTPQKEPGWVDAVTKPPLDVIALRGTAGSGRVDLQEATVKSPSFLAEAKGTVTLAPILTNSTLNIPLSVALERTLAQKVGLAPTNTPTNLAYFKLPDFVTVKGTPGVPDTSINGLALGGLAFRTTGNLLQGSGNSRLNTASGVLSTIGNLVGGGSSPATNAPSTNKTGGVLGTLGNILGGATAPAPSTTATTNPPSAPSTNATKPRGGFLGGLGNILGGALNQPTNAAPNSRGATNPPAPRR